MASEADSSQSQATDAAGIFPKNGPDPSARSWGHHPSGITFASQHKLPKQPVPSLEASCQRYLEALKPLQSAREQDASIEAVKSFLHGEGPILQAQLEQYNKRQANYFEHFCYEAFLGDDSPVVLNSNAFCSFKADPNPARNDQITRATALVRSAVAFSQAIRGDQLQPDDVRGTPQCSNQYWWLFGVARVPEDDGGRIRMEADAKHIIVLSRGQIYALDVLERESNRIFNEQALSQSLEDIVSDAHSISNQEESQSSIGLLTTEDQRTWSRCRKVLAHEGLKNGQSLSIIDSSLFALCLDDNSPENDSEICRNMICGTNLVKDGVQVGTCLNRWYDKLAVIICKNGAAGMNFEHTCTDGAVDIRMACDIYNGSFKDGKKSSSSVNGTQNGTHETNARSKGLKKLEWDIPTSISDTLRLAERHLVDRIDRHQLEILDFKDYGSTFIKSVGFSPDAFFQMTLQAAYYSTYKHTRSGFEPVVTRQYLHGRTDVVRTTTSEAAAFARLYIDDNATTAEKIAAMKEATEAHAALSKTCANGGSHHRHLYVLQQLWKKRRAFMEANALVPKAGLNGDDKHREPDTTIFTDPGWSQLNSTILMGSNVDNPCLAYAGFGPAADEGFTVCYYIRQDHMAMSVTSRNGQAKRFTDAIERTLKELQAMLKS